jgi:hypothetical protein
MSYFHNKSHIIFLDTNNNKSTLLLYKLQVNQILHCFEKQQLNSFLLGQNKNKVFISPT